MVHLKAAQKFFYELYAVHFMENFVCRIIVDKFRYKGKLLLTANVITYGRVLLGFWGIYIHSLGWQKTGLSMMIFGAWLDSLDGFVAKVFGGSDFGKYLDPAADKACNISYMTYLRFHQDSNVFMVYRVLIIWLILAEILLFCVSMIKYWIVHDRKSQFVVTKEGATYWGKGKMVAECVAILANFLTIAAKAVQSLVASLYAGALLLALASIASHLFTIKQKEAR